MSRNTSIAAQQLGGREYWGGRIKSGKNLILATRNYDNFVSLHYVFSQGILLGGGREKGRDTKVFRQLSSNSPQHLHKTLKICGGSDTGQRGTSMDFTSLLPIGAQALLLKIHYTDFFLVLNFSLNKYYKILFWAILLFSLRKQAMLLLCPQSITITMAHNTTSSIPFLNAFRNLVSSIAFITDDNDETPVSNEERLR